MSQSPSRSDDRSDRQALPEDPLLPALVAFAEQGVARVLAESGLPNSSQDVELLKHHPGSRCSFSIHAGSRRVVVKVFAKNVAPLAELFRRFEREGLATGRAPTVAPLAAYHPDLHLLANEWLVGTGGEQLLESGRSRRLGELAAAWLRLSSTIDIELGAPYGWEEMLGKAHLKVEAAGALTPSLGAQAAQLVEALRSRPPGKRTSGLRHGSFRGSGIVDMEAGPGVIDWDRFKQGPMELDVGTLFAWLVRRARGHPERARQAREVESAVRESLGGLIDEDALAWYQAAELLKWVGHAARQSEVQWAGHVLVEARQVLAGAR